MKSRRAIVTLWGLVATLLLLFPLCLVFGSVDIPFGEVVNVLVGAPVERHTWSVIVLETRLPMACTAMLAGAALGMGK